MNDALALEALTPPDAFGAARAATAVAGRARERRAAERAVAARDADGLAAGALRFASTLAPGAAREVARRVPLDAARPTPRQREGGARVRRARRRRARAGARSSAASRSTSRARPTTSSTRCAAALAHVLVNRDGPRLQPGSRNYERTWIRDGALTSSALVALGHADAARDFLALVRAASSSRTAALPCCVDARGADPTPEHDSTGRLPLRARRVRAAYARRRLRALALAARACAPSRTRSAPRRAPRRRASARERGGATYGILPESITHEGYAKRPVHSYWDDLFARQGLRDAVFLAELIGDDERAAALVGAPRRALERDLVASYRATHEAPRHPPPAGLGRARRLRSDRDRRRLRAGRRAARLPRAGALARPSRATSARWPSAARRDDARRVRALRDPHRDAR